MAASGSPRQLRLPSRSVMPQSRYARTDSMKHRKLRAPSLGQLLGRSTDGRPFLAPVGSHSHHCCLNFGKLKCPREPVIIHLLPQASKFQITQDIFESLFLSTCPIFHTFVTVDDSLLHQAGDDASLLCSCWCFTPTMAVASPLYSVELSSLSLKPMSHSTQSVPMSRSVVTLLYWAIWFPNTSAPRRRPEIEYFHRTNRMVCPPWPGNPASHDT